MKKCLLILIWMVFAGTGLFAQQLSVKSFRLLENDLDARVNFPLKDQNGDPCAIIKVVTTQKGFSFDGGMTGIVKTVDKPAEIWVYVPWGLKRITISHPQLGMLRDYMLNQSIEKATVYEMVLISGRVETTVVEEITSQWLVINPDPEDAMVYLDDKFMKYGMYQTKLKPGNYSYRVELPLYHPEIGSIQIGNERKEINVKLKPAFGDIWVSTEPEQGAKVIVDGRVQVNTTPCRTEPLSKGEHTVQVVKEMYQPIIQKINITEGKTDSLNLNLQAGFAQVNVTAIANAAIYINNELKGTNSWQGRLSPGVYTVEARLENYRTARQDIDVEAGETKNIILNPEPVFGMLDVLTTPTGATIIIDNTTYQTTPATIRQLLTGKHVVQLQKTGYATTTDTVIITEGKTTELNLKLQEARRVTISSYPFNLNLFVDGTLLGRTPQRANLTLGTHNIRIESKDKSAEKNINISKKEETNTYILSLKTGELFQGMNLKIDSVQPPKPRIPTRFFLEAGVTMPLIQNTTGELKFERLSYNLRLVRAKKHGIYTKLTYNFSNEAIDYTLNDFPKTMYAKPLHSSFNRFGIVGGGMLDFKAVKLYGGLGWGYFTHFTTSDVYNYSTETKTGTKKIADNNSFKGIETDTGLSIAIGKRITLSAGISTIQFKYAEITAGLGIKF